MFPICDDASETYLQYPEITSETPVIYDKASFWIFFRYAFEVEGFWLRARGWGWGRGSRTAALSVHEVST